MEKNIEKNIYINTHIWNTLLFSSIKKHCKLTICQLIKEYKNIYVTESLYINVTESNIYICVKYTYI